MLSCGGVQKVVNRSVRWTKMSLATVLLSCKNRGRVDPVLALKAFGGNRCMAPITLTLSIVKSVEYLLLTDIYKYL